MNALIAVRRADASVAALWLRGSGHLHAVGPMLLEHYAQREKVEALVALGSLSRLAGEPAQCLSLTTLPRSELESSPQLYASARAMYERAVLDWTTWCYLYAPSDQDGHTWRVRALGEPAWRGLADALASAPA